MHFSAGLVRIDEAVLLFENTQRHYSGTHVADALTTTHFSCVAIQTL